MKNAKYMYSRNTHHRRTEPSLDFNFIANVEIPTKLSHYEILEQIGEGGIARVYKAYDTKLCRNVALKIIKKGVADSEQARKRFIQEIKLQANISVPGCVKIFDWGEEKNCLYCVMELIKGDSLSRILNKNNFTLYEKIELLYKISSIIDDLHSIGFEHRDIKPGNIIIDDKQNVFLLDFGLAKATNPDVNIYTTTYGEFFGTPAYMPPENIDGNVYTAKEYYLDIYSFAVMAYEFITGKLPYEIDHLSREELTFVIKNETPVPIEEYEPNIKPEIAEAINLSLSKNPSIRPDIKQIKSVLSADEITVNEIYHTKIKKASGKKTLLVTAAALALMVIASAVIIFKSSTKESNNDFEKYLSTKTKKAGEIFTIPFFNIQMKKILTGSLTRKKSTQTISIETPYLIGIYEVTEEEFSKVPIFSNWKFISENKKYPVRNVSWHQAMKFCKYLTAKERESGRISDELEFRLPTSDEWEYAASAGSIYDYFHGSLKEQLPIYAVIETGKVSEVGSKKPNKFGLYDSLGNVWEWCYDMAGEHALVSEIPTNNSNTEQYANRLIRGGSASDSLSRVKLSSQMGISPHVKNNMIGFRIVLGKPIPN